MSALALISLIIRSTHEQGTCL